MLDQTRTVQDSTDLPSARAQASALVVMKAFRDKVGPAKGVVLVTCADPTILTVAVAAVAHGINTDGTIADLPVCPVSTITLLHSSGSREAESVKSYARTGNQADKLKAESIHCRRFNPLAPEGVHLVTCRLKPETCILTTLEYSELKRDEAIVALTDLNAEAEKLGALVVIYVQHTKKDDVTWLRKYGAVSIDVRKCEPGPGAPVAIVLDNLTLASEHVQGIGRVMVEAVREPDGGWTYRREPFIAERAVIRLAWYLAWERANLRDIAKIVGIAASNISRGFQPLLIQPKNAVGLAPPCDWRTRWAGGFDLNSGNSDVKHEPADAPSNRTVSQDTGHQKIDTGLTRSTGIGNEPAKSAMPASVRRNRLE